MTFTDSLLRRNEEFAADGFDPALRMTPSGKALIITCVDPRVDPMALFKLEQGEAAIYRNVGGRVNEALVETLGLLRTVSKAAGGNPNVPTNLVVLHHTDCGIKHAHAHVPEQLAHHLGVAPDGLDGKAVSDPYKSVALDIEALRDNPAVTGSYLVSGLVYDVATGKVETVVPPSPLRPEPV